MKLPALSNLAALVLNLGVAEGKFSEKLLRKSNLSVLYSIDAWAGDRGHDDTQFKKARQLLAPYGNRSVIIRKKFADAVKDFPNEHFDFIYIDGYAHTGQEEGETLRQWYPKLKSGGIFSGDDYTEKYPKVIQQVDKFCSLHKLELKVIKDWNSHHSWLVIKP